MEIKQRDEYRKQLESLLGREPEEYLAIAKSMHEATERITKAINVNKELLTPREVELLETWLQSAIGDGLELLENFVKAFAEELSELQRQST